LSKYHGKQINNIIIEQHNFSTNINLPQINQKDKFTNIANKLHKSSSDNTIRKNLFFKPNELLNPTIIAYNEKWLRDLTFIQDARIIAIPVKYDTNKVDLFIITKDIFPLGGNLNLKNQNSFDASISDENLFGNRVFRLSDHCGLDSCISYVYLVLLQF
jgi:outer membrane protein assembly factor BamA